VLAVLLNQRAVRLPVQLIGEIERVVAKPIAASGAAAISIGNQHSRDRARAGGVVLVDLGVRLRAITAVRKTSIAPRGQVRRCIGITDGYHRNKSAFAMTAGDLAFPHFQPHTQRRPT